MIDKTYEQKIIDRLMVLVSVLAIIALILFYMYHDYTEKGSIYKLIHEAIPGAIVVLVAIPITYFLFKEKRSPFSKSSKNIEELYMEKLPQIMDFHESYRHIDWSKLLRGTNSTIDIIVYYYDSWVNSNYDDIVLFFRKPNTTMRVFVANPHDSFIFSTIRRLFPDSGAETIMEKVSKTGERLARALKAAGGDSRRLEFYYVPHILNYSAQCIDEKILILSIFEMFRESRIDSPAILIDLNKSEHLAKFWNKELKGLLDESKKINVKLGD